MISASLVDTNTYQVDVAGATETHERVPIRLAVLLT